MTDQASTCSTCTSTAKLQLYLSAANLPRQTAKLSAQHVRAQVYIIPINFVGGEKPIHLGTTEVVKSIHPSWATFFHLEYEYGSQLTFCVNLLSGKSGDADPKSIGIANFEVGDVLGSRNKTKAKRLRSGGVVFAHVEQSASGDQHAGGQLIFQLSATNLAYGQKKNMSLLRSAPTTFFEIARQTKTESGNIPTWVVIYRSQPVLESAQPCWDRAEVDMHTFCNGDPKRAILISVYVHKKSGTHVLLGSFETTVEVLLNKAENYTERDGEQSSASTFPLQPPGCHNCDSVGTISVLEGSILLHADSVVQNSDPDAPSLPSHAPNESSASTSTIHTSSRNHTVDSPGGASCTSVTVDIESLDISGSPQRAHYRGESIDSFQPLTPDRSGTSRPSFSDYVHSGLEIDFCCAIDFTSSNGDPRIPGTLHYNSGDALNDYEETIMSVGKSIAKYSESHEFPVWGFGAKYGGVVRHLFQCGPTATAHGVDGILEDYRSVFATDLIMSGPTSILDVTKAAAVRTKKFEKKSLRYCVLLILTDGIVSDADATKALLHSISDLPLTILIVGIGTADFKPMQEIVEYSNSTSRSNVSFVSYRPHQHDPRSLSKAALSDIPGHIVDYFSSEGIEP